MDLRQMGILAKEASIALGGIGTGDKNRGLLAAAEALLVNEKAILKANEKDIMNAKANGMKPALIDRLLLTPERVAGMADGLRQVAALEDPVGEVISMKLRPNGLTIGEKRVPLGVVGMIYEARPNVTADAFGLCFKTGNAVILKGGSDALYSNIAIAGCIREALKACSLPENAVLLITDTNREITVELMKLNDYLDVLIPRGSAGLIQTVVKNSTVPVIETGIGNCHVFIDESADLDMGVEIIYNAKTQRIGVCNACESVLIHESRIKDVMPLLAKRLKEKNVEIRGDKKICSICPEAILAAEEDWGREYLDYIISIKTVQNLNEAIAHINKYGTKHSEAIITESYSHAQRFLNEIDAAAVYVNASTRYTDGCEFGLGAELGISTQKLHARGPMGLKALTTTKFIIYGNGQVRP